MSSHLLQHVVATSISYSDFASCDTILVILRHTKNELSYKCIDNIGYIIRCILWVALNRCSCMHMLNERIRLYFIMMLKTKLDLVFRPYLYFIRFIVCAYCCFRTPCFSFFIILKVSYFLFQLFGVSW